MQETWTTFDFGNRWFQTFWEFKVQKSFEFGKYQINDFHQTANIDGET